MSTKCSVTDISIKSEFQSPIKLLSELRRATKSGSKVLAIAWEREGGYVSRYDLPLPARAESCPEVVRLAERIVKFMLWACGGWKLSLAGPRKLCQEIKEQYSKNGERSFDAKFMEGVYGQPMMVEIVPLAKMPESRERRIKVAQRSDGYRLGFDLGSSDFKISALKSGKEVFSKEFPWEPHTQRDPEYHYDLVINALKKAAETLPRVDVIGGSSAGVIVDNRIKVASLIRSVPQGELYTTAQNIFKRIEAEFKVPVEVANDGDVSALAGLMALGRKGMLGVAMGSSEAVGFVDRRGCLTGRLSELAFAPVDMNPEAPADEWSQDIGVGAMYFSQQAVNHLATKMGVKFPKSMKLPERLKKVQGMMEKEDVVALRIFQRIGLFLGYSVPWYREFYGFDSMMLLGRVTSGYGGIVMQETASMVLEDQYPEIAAEVELFMPDEKFRRLGQSVAAAQIPAIKKKRAACAKPKSTRKCTPKMK